MGIFGTLTIFFIKIGANENIVWKLTFSEEGFGGNLPGSNENHFDCLKCGYLLNFKEA